MPWNGSGAFNRLFSWQADKAAGLDITASRMDGDTNDIISNGFGNCITRDGQGAPIANIAMGGHRITGAGVAVGSGDYTTLGQIQASITTVTATISGNASVGGTLGVTSALSSGSFATGAISAASLTLTGAISGVTNVAASGTVSGAQGTFTNINSSGSTALATASVSNLTAIIPNGVNFGGRDSGGTARGMFSYDSANNISFFTGTGGRWRVMNNAFTTELFGVDSSGNIACPGSLSSGSITTGGATLGTTTIAGTGLTINGSTSVGMTGWQLNATGTGAFASSGAVALQTTNFIQAGIFVATSDARVKTDARAITPADGERFVRTVPGRVYRKRGVWEAGFFAQDIEAGGFCEILTQFDDPDMPAEQNGASGPAGKRWEVIQGAPQAYLAAALNSALDRISALENRI